MTDSPFVLAEPLLPMHLPRPKPDRSDKKLMAAAASALAKSMALTPPNDSFAGVKIDELADEIAEVAYAYDDGASLADKLCRRHGYENDTEVVEALDEWSHRLRTVLDEATKVWVAETHPVAPFERIARVTVTSRFRPPQPGIAYRTTQTDELAKCLVVTDDSRAKYMTDGTFSGGMYVDWDDISEVVPASEEDITILDATEARATARREASERRRNSEARERDFQARAAAFGRSPDMDLRDATRLLDEASASATFDAHSDVAARVVGMLGASRSSKAASPSPNAS